jgi:hypothetical protein
MAGGFQDGNDWRQIVTELLHQGHDRSGRIDATDTYFGVALEDIRQGTPIRLFDGEDVGIRPATSADGLISGIAVADAKQGTRLLYVTRGFVFVDSWQAVLGVERLTAGRRYWLSTEGHLSASAPLSGFAIIVGQAQSWHILDVSISNRLKV